MEFNLVPDLKDRTKEWAEFITRTIASSALTDIQSRKRDKICFMYYNGIKTEEDFNYLNQVGDYVYPAKVRFFQIIRPKIDLQISKLTTRPLHYGCIASDEKSQRERYEKKLKHYFDLFDQRIDSIRQPELEAITEIEQNIGQIRQILANKPQNEEQAQMQEELLKVKDELITMLIQLKTKKERIVLLTQDDEEKIDHFFKYKYKDVLELAASKYLQKAIQERDIERKSISAFKEQGITGKPIYFVDPVEGEKYPIFEQISSLYTCWSGASPTGYIQDGDWATYTVPMSIGEILTRFGQYLKKTDIERIKKFRTLISDSSVKTNVNNGAYFPDDQYNTAYSGNMIDGVINVTYVFWRSPRKIIRKFTPNPHVPKSHFSHIINEEEVLEKGLRDGEYINVRYIDDIYEGVLIGNASGGVVVNAGPRKYQVYDVDTFKTELPIIGYTFNGIDDAPYSYVWSTKDLQDLYNILMYQAELLTVLSGVKGIIMDKSQRPDDMTPEQWVYNRKMGVAWIDTMKKKFQRFPTFNQFTQYDDSLSQSVMYILGMARDIDEMAGQIIGIPRQAIGQTISTDQVGTNKMSIDQSAIINEIHFYKHFNLLGKALSRLMNCAREQGFIDDVISFSNSDLTNEDFALPKDMFDGRKYDILVSNSVKELDFMEDFRRIAMQERGAGQIALHDLIKVYQGSTLKEIETTLEFASKRMAEQMQAAAGNAQQAEMQKEQALKEMDMRFQELNNQMQMQLKQLDAQIKERELQFNAAQKITEQDIQAKEAEQNRALKEREIQIKAADVQNKIVSDDFKNRLSGLTQKVDTLLGSRKLDIEEKKVNKMNTNTK